MLHLLKIGEVLMFLSLKNKSPDSYNVSIANDNNELLSSKI